LGTGLLRPDDDVEVVISKRGKEGVDWDVQFGERGEGKDPVAEGERITCLE
tara:strand:- start:5326 stop:5478 length:153 start_codon:yes stop_codon:yes gene_type:complete